MKVVLEGNTDERGSAEYNMVLGLKRAEAVEKSLVTFGVSKSQIKVVSYGKSRPKMNCHEEKCWHENRRVDFVPQ
jgi:peptidoglycan-associated lipoprotein